MQENLLKLLCKKNNSSYIIFDKNFEILQTHNIDINAHSDIRDFLWELVGLEESILALDTKQQSIEIPMLYRENNYYDLDIDTFVSDTNERLYVAYMQKKSKQTDEYAKVIKEINKKTLIYETSEEKKQNSYNKQISKRLITFNVDLDGFITRVNDACSHFFNLEKEKLTHQHFSNFFHAQKSKIDSQTHIFSAKNSLGENIFFHADIIPITDTKNRVIENIVIAQDISYLKQVEKELEDVSQYDTLTGLPNRHYLLKRVESHIQKESPFTLCFIDIDDFSIINEEHGAHAGDMLLKHITTLISSVIERNDILVRVYGDMFVILFEEDTNRVYLEAIIEKLQESTLSHPLKYTADDIIEFTCTTLLLEYPDHLTETRELLENAKKSIKKIKIDKKSTR